MELLPDVKEKLIEKITISISLNALDSTLVMELGTLIKENPGTTELYFKINDPDQNIYVDLVSKPIKLSVGKDLISFIQSNSELDFRIN